MAEPLGLDFRVARLWQPDRLDALLEGAGAVVHVAGPFSSTWRPMFEACLRTRTHYLDVTGEIAVVEALHRRGAEAAAAGLTVMPALGFDAVPLDCLAAHVAARLGGAERLRIGMSFPGSPPLSRGSAKTLIENVRRPAEIRRDGRIVAVAPGSLERSFDYGGGPRPSTAVTAGVVSTAFHTTGVANVEAYFDAGAPERASLALSRALGWLFETAPWQVLLKTQTDLMPEGPTERQRAECRAVVVAEAEDAAGRRARSRLLTPEAYTLSCQAALAVTRRVLAGDFEAGFQTAAGLYGADFVLALDGARREDLEV